MRRVPVLLCKRCGFVVRQMESAAKVTAHTLFVAAERHRRVCLKECSYGLLPACVLHKRLAELPSLSPADL